MIFCCVWCVYFEVVNSIRFDFAQTQQTETFKIKFNKNRIFLFFFFLKFWMLNQNLNFKRRKKFETKKKKMARDNRRVCLFMWVCHQITHTKNESLRIIKNWRHLLARILIIQVMACNVCLYGWQTIRNEMRKNNKNKTRINFFRLKQKI